MPKLNRVMLELSRGDSNEAVTIPDHFSRYYPSLRLLGLWNPIKFFRELLNLIRKLHPRIIFVSKTGIPRLQVPRIIEYQLPQHGCAPHDLAEHFALLRALRLNRRSDVLKCAQGKIPPTPDRIKSAYQPPTRADMQIKSPRPPCSHTTHVKYNLFLLAAGVLNVCARFRAMAGCASSRTAGCWCVWNRCVYAASASGAGVKRSKKDVKSLRDVAAGFGERKSPVAERISTDSDDIMDGELDGN